MSTVMEPREGSMQGGGVTGYGRGQPRATRARREGGDGHGGEAESLATFLGWFSLGLGLAQVAAPAGLARLIGVRPDDDTVRGMRMVGLREIASGIGILSQPQPREWVAARVAGDMMDLALLGRALASNSTDPERTASATAAVLGITALDVHVQRELGRTPETAAARREKETGIRVQKSITVNRPIDEVYRFWHDFENLPRFMSHLESVRVTAPGLSHWRAHGPAQTIVEWDAVVTAEEVNVLIAWRSVEGSEVRSAGSVRFTPAPHGRGTEVRVAMSYDPPGGVVAATMAKLFGEEPGQKVDGDLRAFKQVLEAGEVVVSDATVRKAPHPARPPEMASARNS